MKAIEVVGALFFCIVFTFTPEDSYAFPGGSKSSSLSDSNRRMRIGGQTYPFKENLSFQIPVCDCSSCARTSGYGPRRRPKRGASRFHRAVDIGAPRGTPVLAMESGVVSIRSNSLRRGYGMQLSVVHNPNFESRYAHLSKFIKTSGWVNKGELIGLSGNTGVSTGPHIHLEILKNGVKMNPENYTTVERQFLTTNRCKSSPSGGHPTERRNRGRRSSSGGIM